jgi:hypothetical protein
MSWLVGPVILLLVGVGFVLWDRRLPASASPDKRMVQIGIALTVVGLSSFFLWWLIVPVIVLLVGALADRCRTAPRHRLVRYGVACGTRSSGSG